MCVAQGYVVFLDVKKDEYSALTRDEALRERDAIAEWPVTAMDSGDAENAPLGGEKLLQELHDEGLITRKEVAGKAASPVAFEEPASDMRSLMLGTSNVPAMHTARFLVAWASVTLALRARSLEHSVERVRRRKAANSHPSMPLELDDVRPLIASYFELQPRFFSSYDACLRNSLTFIKYLTLNGVYPTWVFVVHMKPWAAHSWVQDGGVVLNDTVEHVRNFTPILAI